MRYGQAKKTYTCLLLTLVCLVIHTQLISTRGGERRPSEPGLAGPVGTLQRVYYAFSPARARAHGGARTARAMAIPYDHISLHSTHRVLAMYDPTRARACGTYIPAAGC